jgi:nicotinate-nucleotide adenylyltransferase
MGADGLVTFYKWKNHSLIEENYDRYIYPRPGYEIAADQHARITLVDAPQMEISSTFIREALKKRHDIRHFLPRDVYTYLSEMHFYEK